MGVFHKRDSFRRKVSSGLFARSWRVLLLVLSQADSPTRANLEMGGLDVRVDIGWQFVAEVFYILLAPEREIGCCLSSEFSALLSKSNGIKFHFALNLETFEVTTVR